MFRSFSGSRAQYRDLTLIVVSELDHWSVLVYGPGVTLHGQRQFAEAKAREHAAAIAHTYIQEMKHDESPDPVLEWQPTAPEDWLAWRT